MVRVPLNISKQINHFEWFSVGQTTAPTIFTVIFSIFTQKVYRLMVCDLYVCYFSIIIYMYLFDFAL